MDLGDKIPRLPGREKTDANRVHGCQSTVHLTARKRPGTADVLDFAAESDAFIVNGLIALLERVFAGQTARQILDFDVLGFLKKLGLDQHLSMGRRNGLAGMIERIPRRGGEAGDVSGAVKMMSALAPPIDSHAQGQSVPLLRKSFPRMRNTVSAQGQEVSALARKVREHAREDAAHAHNLCDGDA